MSYNSDFVRIDNGLNLLKDKNEFIQYLQNNYIQIENPDKLKQLNSVMWSNNNTSIAYVFWFLYFYIKLLIQMNNCKSMMIEQIMTNFLNSFDIFYNSIKQRLQDQDYIKTQLLNTYNINMSKIQTDIQRFCPGAQNIINGGMKRKTSKRFRKSRNRKYGKSRNRKYGKSRNRK
jgi:hypothetical protein